MSSPAASPVSRVASELADDVSGVLTDVLTRAQGLLDVDTVTVLLLDPTGSYLDTVATLGIEATMRQRARVPLGKGFAGRVAAERGPVVIAAVSQDNVVNPLLIRRGLHSLLGVPLLEQGELLGVLHVGSVRPRHFDEHDCQVLQGISHSVAHVLHQRMESSERAAAGALQRSLLPSKLPRIPGLDLAARYLPAVGSLGGDWYDVFTLPHNGGQDRVGVVIGDVAGHGLEAAIVMGRLRSALRAYALDWEDPAAVLERLDRKIHHFEPNAMATVMYAVTDPPYERIRISSAGHPAPLLVSPGEETSPLPLTPDLPVGVSTGWQRHSQEFSLGEDDALLFFTDGLIERRPPARTSSTSQTLCQALQPEAAEEMCRQAIDVMFSSYQPQDDTAVLALRRHPDQ